ncbi:MAG: Thiopurine S-methyltransferase [uncultured Cytophagales bacterium]|uniref:Thiopurine S-methyltransferase n=1 Tax=uncultured Cytophagales bacterium TaxID=158755 RepID=A0A6J4IF92_9SPHI|nr:MAG: Thiopurine S-methyltransferase [uncultured Cytophagales bacterium]
MDETYWESRWQQGQTGWDLGQASPPLKAYLEGVTDTSLAILIPGCGNAYEAAYLVERGFTDVTLLDIAPTAVARLREQFGDRVRVQEADFFAWEGAYDLILEQTFFCALPPDRRPAYVRHMHRLLKPGGRLVGVLFDREFGTTGPPFGGSRAEYEALFAPFFTPRVLAPCYNSAPPRRGTEVFISLEKPT